MAKNNAPDISWRFSPVFDLFIENRAFYFGEQKINLTFA